MKMGADYVEIYRRRQRWAEDTQMLEEAIDMAIADARADERVKATAEVYEQVSRTFIPRGSVEE